MPQAGIDAMTAISARSFPRHVHDQYGVGLLDRGRHASASDRRQIEAGPGQLIFVNPGEVHDGRAIGGRSRAWRMLYFDPVAIATARQQLGDQQQAEWTFAAPVLAHDALRRCFDAAFAYASVRAPRSLGGDVEMLALIAAIGSHATTQRSEPDRSSVSLRGVREKIDADPSAALSLATLAAEAGASRFQLVRAFARETGLTPHAYILQRRLALARQLLRRQHSPSDAALRAGFCDQSHLTRHFTRQFGASPGRYARYGV